ncbi:unnamed protein product [Lasius platythorax]|uniref:THAP-type domain-containing protein n=1 Tax=Lasius platythorax TaxID=488582 RepID=A0AAV2NDY6_9HYME
MPACCIINCTSRTDSAHKTIKLFRFPKDKSIRQQWIKACRRNEIDINIDAARICNLHFQEDCFEIKWTKPRAENVPAKEIRRLKKNSVPSLLLHLEKKNKMKAKVRMGISTYAELVKYAQQKQQTQEHEQNLSNEIVREEDIQDIQDIHTMNSEDVNEQNISAEELKQLLIKEKKEKEMLLKEKNELLQEKQTLLGDNEKLKQQMDVLMKKITEKKR